MKLTFDDEGSTWITSRMKKAINNKNLAFELFGKNKGFLNNNTNLERYTSFQKSLSCLIQTSNQEYFSKMA